MLEFLKEKGNALKNFLDKDDDEKEETKSAVEELIEFQKAKKESVEEMTDEQKKLATTEDIEKETKSVEQILKEAEDKKKEEKTEKNLEDKLSDIEKVISTFSSKPLGPSTDPFANTKFQLNKPIDFQQKVATNYIAPFMQQPSVQGDRIKLLFESLKKQNLI